MDAFEPKKLALFRIYQILQKYSDYDHPMTQAQIAQKLEDEYGIVLERKAVSRNLSLLKEAGEDIESDARGSYLNSRVFDDSELRLLIDSVLASRFIRADQSLDIAERLADLSNEYFRSGVTHMHTVSDWVKSESRELFLNIEIIAEAIEKKKKIQFQRWFYYENHGRPERLATGGETVTPLQMMIHNQQYYLLTVRGDKSRWYPDVYEIDRMQKIDILENEPALNIDPVEARKLIDYEKLSQDTGSGAPALDEKMIYVRFLMNEQFVNEAVRAFGNGIRLQRLPQLTGQEQSQYFPPDKDDTLWDIISRSLFASEPMLMEVRTTESAAMQFVRDNSSQVFLFEPGYMRKRIQHEFESAARMAAQVEKVVPWQKKRTSQYDLKRPEPESHGTGMTDGGDEEKADDGMVLDVDDKGRTVSYAEKERDKMQKQR